MRALKNHVDKYGKQRLWHEEYLITSDDAATHIPSLLEEYIGAVNITVVKDHQYCVVCDPVDAYGRPRLGEKKLIIGPDSFFLNPKESLENGVQNAYLLQHNEGLILQAMVAQQVSFLVGAGVRLVCSEQVRSLCSSFNCFGFIWYTLVPTDDFLQ